MFAGAGPEIIVSGGCGPSLTDVLVVLYCLFYRVFQLTIPRELKFSRTEGEVKVLGAVAVGVEVWCGSPITYSYRNLYKHLQFAGGGGPDHLTPPLHYGFIIQKSRESRAASWYL